LRIAVHSLPFHNVPIDRVVTMSRTRDSIRDIWGERTPYEGDGQWPVRVDQQTEAEPERWVQSCCMLCSNGCGLDIGVKDGRVVGVRGRAVDRVNHGRLGPKGLNGWQANHSADRLTRPLISEGGAFREASWDEAMDLVVRRCREAIEKYTPSGVGIYNSGQLFLEEYYALSMIAYAGIGTNQVDGNTRLCTATSSQALRETFGSDGQPCSYSDLDLTDCLFIVGNNMAETQTVLWMRVLDRLAGPRRPKVIVVDPRRTPTAAAADVHLAPRLGTNVALLNGLLHLLIAGGNIDRPFVEEHTQDFERLAKVVHEYPPKRVQQITDVSEKKTSGSSGDHWRGALARIDRSARRVSIESGDRCGLSGEQCQFAAGQNRPAGQRYLANERTADGAEHARDGMRR